MAELYIKPVMQEGYCFKCRAKYKIRKYKRYNTSTPHGVDKPYIMGICAKCGGPVAKFVKTRRNEDED